MRIQVTTSLWMVLLIGILMAGCKEERGRPVPDVDDIEVDMEITRFEKVLQKVDTANAKSQLLTIRRDYPQIYDCYTQNITGIARQEDTTYSYVGELAGYLNYPGYEAAYDSTMKAYPELGFLEEELQQAFKFYRHYFPDKHIPEVFSFVSEYGYGSVTCYDSLLGVGLDFYLGKDFPYYKSLNYPAYITRRLNRDHITRDAMMSLAQNEYGSEVESNRLLDRMVFQGKLLYFLDLTLPHTPDSIKIAYSQPQMEWVEANESEIWAYFLDKDRLFLTDRMDGNDYVRVGPRTPGMPPEAPGYIGSWVGWQIVRAYMNNNREMGYEDLMQMENGQKILKLSGYKP